MQIIFLLKLLLWLSEFDSQDNHFHIPYDLFLLSDFLFFDQQTATLSLYRLFESKDCRFGFCLFRVS